MEKFTPPELVIPVAVVTTFAVAAAVLVNVFGFVIATYHYSKMGVSPGAVPLMSMWGAGLSFSVLTSIFFHIGFVSMKLGESSRPKEAYWYAALAIALILLISAFLIRYSGLLTYSIGCLAVGGLAAKGWRFPEYVPRVTADSVTIAWPAVGFLGLLGLLWAYSVLAYPNLAGSLGGAAPQPVRLVLQDDFRDAIAPGSRVYQALVTPDAYYFEVQLPEGAPRPERVDLFLFRRFDPPATYLQVSRAAVRYIEYTDTFRSAPVVDETGTTVSPAPVSSTVAEPQPAAATGAAPAGPGVKPEGLGSK